MTIHMICGKYYDFINKKKTIGGIQTYIKSLISVANEIGMDCHIYQQGTSNNEISIDGGVLTEVPVKKKWKEKRKVQEEVNACKDNYDINNDILLFTTDARIVPTRFDRVLAIQHGISWDIPNNGNVSRLKEYFSIISKAFRTLFLVKRIKNVNELICVDYNFQCWLRANTKYKTVATKVIPNYTSIPDVFEKPSDSINIIFARRLVNYRGTIVFVDAIERILKKYDNVKVTIAGSGPDKKLMEERLKNYLDKVEFTTYESSDSLLVHANKHIAIVPTIGSEGTSLSLLEAMAAQCAVICTDVGGMTNIVLNGYNGIIVESGSSNDLYNGIAELIENEKKRVMIAQHAYETVSESFCYERWKEQWIDVLKGICK